MSSLELARFQEAWSFVSAWRRPLLVSHEKPDGDALGALVAVRELLRSRNVPATAMLFDPLPERYEWFRRYDDFAVLGRDVPVEGLSAFDGIVLLDTCAFSQLRPIADWLRSAPRPKLVVDHHATRDELGAVELVEVSAAATCLILHDWARALNWEVSPGAAQALFIGIATDTGWFRHSNTDHRVLSACADLVARGVRANDIYQALYERESIGRVRLLGQALHSLQLRRDGKLAMMSLDARAFRNASATPADTEDIVNEPLRVGGVLVSVLLVEQENGVVRVNFRSRAPIAGEAGATDIDVAAVAQSFGGGGHRRAAGARIEGPLSDVEAQVAQRIEAAMRTLTAGSNDP